eukprot:COSAG01_NODE_1695_length_9464_cov_4.884677_6_plen_233_part_00
MASKWRARRIIKAPQVSGRGPAHSDCGGRTGAAEEQEPGRGGARGWMVSGHGRTGAAVEQKARRGGRHDQRAEPRLGELAVHPRPPPEGGDCLGGGSPPRTAAAAEAKAKEGEGRRQQRLVPPPPQQQHQPAPHSPQCCCHRHHLPPWRLRTSAVTVLAVAAPQHHASRGDAARSIRRGCLHRPLPEITVSLSALPLCQLKAPARIAVRRRHHARHPYGRGPAPALGSWVIA